MTIERRYFHFRDLEECQQGMWKIVRGETRRRFIAEAALLMQKSNEFQTAMRRALVEWPNSCENAFSADAINHLAWLGHAGCFLATGSPEEATRCAWHTLTPSEQKEANRVAAIVVDEWFFANRIQGDLFNA